jgi:glucosamine kinase
MNVIAVDAGGTRCRLALITDDHVQSVEARSANASTDLQAAAAAIIAGLETLSRKTGHSPEQLESYPAYLGVAGVVEPSIGERLKALLPFACAQVDEDRMSALRGALGNDDGYLVHCGTGSFFARQRKQTMSTVGGWGAQLDDVASAHWLGIEALRHTLCAEDGLEPHSAMTKSLVSTVGNSAAIVDFARKSQPSVIAELATTVTQCADDKDATAIGVLQRGADIISRKLDQFGWTPDDIICLTGGVARYYETYFPHPVRSSIRPAKGTPLEGAIALAKTFCEEQRS